MPRIGLRKRLAPPGPAKRVEDDRRIEHRLCHIHGSTELMGRGARRGARVRATPRAPADAPACGRLSPAGAVTLHYVDPATGEAFGVPERAKCKRLELHAVD